MTLETCAAYATPPGAAGLAVLRLSGEQAPRWADKLFCPGPLKPAAEVLSSFLSQQTVQKLPGYTCRFGYVYDPQTGHPIDQCVLTRFAAPHSYTGEEVVEFSIHGGQAVREALLQAVLSLGAKPAGPGEFTKRAFLHGKLDLLQAEAVMDLIEAEASRQAQQALAQLEGRLSDQIKRLRQPLVEARARLELSLQYPEHEEALCPKSSLFPILDTARQACETLLAGYHQGRVVREGLSVALAGSPNAGKSTLMNAFLGVNRAIVTEIEGTTRDTLEERLQLDGYLINLIDTAGLREASDVVERMGVDRSWAAFQQADLVLWLISSVSGEGDWAQNLQDWQQLARQCVQPLTLLPILSQVDRLDSARAEAQFKAFQAWVNQQQPDFAQTALTVLEPVELSAYAPDGLTAVKGQLLDFCQNQSHYKNQGSLLTTHRQRQIVEQTHQILQTVLLDFEQLPEDLISLSLEAAAEQLAELTGETAHESLIEELFSRFCVGK